MKVYLAGSIAGGREYSKYLKLICDYLKKMGHVVVTEDNVVKTLSKYTNVSTIRTRRNIMKRDKKWIRESDVFIAEVSTYSHGVGYEHAYAESLDKPILLLRHKSLQNKRYSAFLDGSDYKKFSFTFYNKSNLLKILEEFFDRS